VFVSDIGSFAPGNIEVAVETISQAFFDDPMYVHIEPDEGKRMRVLKAQNGVVVRMFFRVGLIDSTPDAKGVALWLKPGNTSPSPVKMLQSGALAVPFRSGFRSFFRLMSMLSAGDVPHKKAAPGSHWYLGITAVDPSLQGKGIGTALIKRGLERADADGLPCYLETSRERNVSFWEKYGFKVSHTGVLPNGGPRFWGMLRESSS
jgi:ribosomal protein S18 acetylase RimI-like enzyme